MNDEHDKLSHFRAVQKCCAAIHHEGAKGEKDLGARWGEWLASRPGRALPPGKGSRYLMDKRLGGPRYVKGIHSFIFLSFLTWNIGPLSGFL
jgi:hypothetical protein